VDAFWHRIEAQLAEIADHIGLEPQRSDRQRLDQLGAFPLRNDKPRPGGEPGQRVRRTPGIGHRCAGG
jgi:hypothetical protein